VGVYSRLFTFFGVLIAVTAASFGCIPMGGSSERTAVRRYRPPRPVPTSKSWRGERPGYYIYTGFVRTSSRLPKARSSKCRIDVLLDGPPELPYEILGLVSVEKIGPALVGLRGGEEQAVGWLKSKACRVGATAIYDVKTDGQWFEYRDRLVRSIRATAVAAIYIQAPAVPGRSVPPAPPAPPTEGTQDQQSAPPGEEGQGQEGARPPASSTPPTVWLD